MSLVGVVGVGVATVIGGMIPVPARSAAVIIPERRGERRKVRRQLALWTVGIVVVVALTLLELIAVLG